MPRVFSYRRAVSFFLVGALSFAARCQAQESLAPPDDAVLSQPSALDPAAPDAPAANADDLNSLLDAADKDIGQLSQVNVASTQVAEYTPAALTQVEKNVVPAAVTHITRDDIFRSGARNLNELLDIYVPNLELVRHHWEDSHLGVRGIISDRESKYLLLVNRRIMNDRTHFGAISERDLVQLEDIDHIDVIRGPGSAVLGPGAVSMVISIFTQDGENFEGTKVRARGGMVDKFASMEVKNGRQWKDAEGGLFLYGGLGDRDGASPNVAPLVFGTSNPPNPGFGNPTTLYDGYVAGDRVRAPINNDGEAFRDQLPAKLFADLTYNDFEVWGRYTRSGIQFPLAPSAGFNTPQGFGTFVPQLQSGVGTQQTSVQGKYETELTENLKFLGITGWNSSDFVRDLFSGTVDAYNEQDYNARALLISELGNHQIAAGGEFYQDWFGREQHLVNAPPTNSRLGNQFTPWDAQTYSLLGEDQWKVTDDFTTFIGGRLDHNTYTPWMFSPRAAFVWTPEDDRTWKLLLNRSLRMNFAEENRAQWLMNGTQSQPEILRSYELRREGTPSERLFWAFSGFYIDLDALAWNQNASTSSLVGNQTQWGLEAEASYRDAYWTVTGSQCFTKLAHFTLFDPTVTTFITAAPDGFGNDLGAWSNHITKLFVHTQLTTLWSWDNSLRYYWGFQGSRDISDRAIALNDPSTAKADPNWKRAFRESCFINSALTCQYSENIRLRVDGYNLAGIFDRDLNKRLYYGDMSFQSEAPALGVSIEAMR